MLPNLTYMISVTVFVMISAINAHAGVQKIAYITNEEDKGIINLELVTDEKEDITHLKLIFKDESGKVSSTDTYKAEKAANGIVLYEVDGRKVVNLSSDNFSSHQGGEIELDFLYNGITGSRGLKKLDLSRSGDSWALADNAKKIKKLHFVSNKKALVGTVGIKQINAL